MVDRWRLERELDIRDLLFDGEKSPRLRSRHDVDFEGHGVMIVAKHTVQDPVPRCLGLGDTGNVVKLVPCFFDWVPSNLLPRWETGAVVEQEVPTNIRWEFSPCTSNGRLERDPLTGGMTVSLSSQGKSSTGPLCMLKQMDGSMSKNQINTWMLSFAIANVSLNFCLLL